MHFITTLMDMYGTWPVAAFCSDQSCLPRRFHTLCVETHIGAMCSPAARTETPHHVVAIAASAAQDAVRQSAHVVVLPEMWNCPYSNDSFPEYAEDIDGGSSQSAAALTEAAKEHGVVLIGGSIPERCGGQLYNTCCIFDADGQLLAKHRFARICLLTFLALHCSQALAVAVRLQALGLPTS